MINRILTGLLRAIVLVLLGAVFAGAAHADQPPPAWSEDVTIAASPSGASLVSGGDSITIWDTRTGKVRLTVPPCGCDNFRLLYPREDTIIRASTNCSGGHPVSEIRFLDAANGRLRKMLKIDLEQASVGIGAPSAIVAQLNGSQAGVFDAATGKRIATAPIKDYRFTDNGMAVHLTKGIPSHIPGGFEVASSDAAKVVAVSPILHRRHDGGPTPIHSTMLTIRDTKASPDVIWEPGSPSTITTAAMQGNDVLIGGTDLAAVWQVGTKDMRSLVDYQSSDDPYDWFGHVHVTWSQFLPGGRALFVEKRMQKVTGKPAFWYKIERTALIVNIESGKIESRFPIGSAW